MISHPSRHQRLSGSKTETCHRCPHDCGVDRTNSFGYCRTGINLEVSHIGLHHGEEPPISGTKGSGTIFFSHCNMRCAFCQNHQISQPIGATQFTVFSTTQLADQMLLLQEQGAHNVNMVSAMHHVPPMIESIRLARRRGLKIPIVYNTNGYEWVETIQALEGWVDIYLPDVKYGVDAAALRYSAVEHYVKTNSDAVSEMWRQVGAVVCDDSGIATRGVIIRHLVLPNNAAGSEKVLDFIAGLSQNATVSLMSQYAPCHRASQYPELSRPLQGDEYDRVVEYALALGLENCFVQELSSQEVFFPDFENATPFNASDR